MMLVRFIIAPCTGESFALEMPTVPAVNDTVILPQNERVYRVVHRTWNIAEEVAVLTVTARGVLQ